MSQPEEVTQVVVERRGDMVSLITNLATLNERIGNLVSTFEKQIVVYDKKFEAHDNRILSIERFQMKIVGGLAVISILLQLGFNLINTWNRQMAPNTVNTQSSYSQPPQTIVETK